MVQLIPAHVDSHRGFIYGQYGWKDGYLAYPILLSVCPVALTTTLEYLISFDT